MITEADDTLSYLQDQVRIVHGPPMDARRDITWKTCTRIMWARFDSLIIIVNCYRMWGLHDRVCVMLSSCSLVRCKLAQVAVTLSEMSDSFLLLSSHSNSTFIMFTLVCENDVDYFVSRGVA
jgi:hypothetical protein